MTAARLAPTTVVCVVSLACGEPHSQLPGEAPPMEALMAVAIPTALELHANEYRRSRARVAAMYYEDVVRGRSAMALDSFYAAFWGSPPNLNVITMMQPMPSAAVDPVARDAWASVAPRWHTSSVDSWHCEGPAGDNRCTLDGLAVSLGRLVVEDNGHAWVRLMITEQTSASDLGHTFYDMQFNMDVDTWRYRKVEIGYAH